MLDKVFFFPLAGAGLTNKVTSGIPMLELPPLLHLLQENM